MFQAKMIEDESYYHLRKKEFLYLILVSLVGGMVFSFVEMAIGLRIFLIGIYVLGIGLMVKNKKGISKITNQTQILIDEEKIRLKPKNGGMEKLIPFAELDRIFLKKEYKMPMEKMSDIRNEFNGKVDMDFIIIEKTGKQDKIDFLVDSYYMYSQLNKIIDSWEKKGFPIERI